MVFFEVSSMFYLVSIFFFYGVLRGFVVFKGLLWFFVF